MCQVFLTDGIKYSRVTDKDKGGSMGKKEIYTQKVIFVTKCMLAAYILTAGLLSEKVVSVCIIAVYIIVTFLAGLIAGKRAGKKKYLWGLCMGVLYFVILVIVSMVVNKGPQDVAGNMMTVFFLCAGSGMLGGMIS